MIIIRNEKPSLILADVNMPHRSGIEFLADLKALEATKDIPVIFVSALSRKQDIQAGLDAGAADYIVKPFSYDDLVERVRKHYSPQPPHKPAEEHPHTPHVPGSNEAQI